MSERHVREWAETEAALGSLFGMTAAQHVLELLDKPDEPTVLPEVGAKRSFPIVVTFADLLRDNTRSAAQVAFEKACEDGWESVSIIGIEDLPERTIFKMQGVRSKEAAHP
jgi:hypothetical protein